jgi:pyruvate kinase
MVFLPFTAHRRDRAAQLVVTLGPASFRLAARLADAGATSFRFNASHFAPADLRQAVVSIHRILPEAPIIIDIQGAKMRLGRFEARLVQAGERLTFSAIRSDQGIIPLPHMELFDQARPEDTLTVDDARLAFEVISIAPERLDARSLAAGRVESRKGVNVREHPVVLKDLCAHDQEILSVLNDCGPLAWAFSFMRDGSEAQWIRRRIGSCVVIGKIELREALARLDSLNRSVDALWVCRGDLGAQMGAIELARWFGSFDPRRCALPVLVAGQVLEHMTAGSNPTRSEVCHLHDLLERGYSGVVLSDETAIGADPEQAVRIAAELIDAFAK